MSEQCREHAHVFKTAKKDCAYCRIAELEAELSGTKGCLIQAQKDYKKLEKERDEAKRGHVSAIEGWVESEARIKELEQENKELQEKCDYFEKKYEDAIFNGRARGCRMGGAKADFGYANALGREIPRQSQKDALDSPKGVEK